MVIAEKMRRWYWMSATVFLVGIISIVLLLWVEHISSRLHVQEMLMDAIKDVQIHTATAHLRLEEIIRGEPEVDVDTALAELDQAIYLSNVILDGGEAENDDLIEESLNDPERRSSAEEIRSLLIEFRALGKVRLQESTGSEKGLALYQQFHSIFREVLSRTRQLEDSIEKDEAKNQKKSRHLFLFIPTIWAIIVITATVGLWSREHQRKRAAEQLMMTHEQLLFQADELRAHRENLAELVDARTAELAAANEHLRSEISERRQAEVALRESGQQLRLLSSRLMTAQETERKSISRELHDELGHALTIIKLRMKFVARACQGNAGSKDECEDIMGYIDQTIENIRGLSRDLSPAILEDLGLTAAVRWLVDNFNRNFDGTIALELEDIDSLFPAEASIMIYRILQEALTNIGKHSDAREASVSVRKVDGAVAFSIEDNGKGFNPSQFFGTDSDGKRLGLAIMRERVRIIGGSFDITSQEGKGTRITFRLPLQKE